MCTESTVPLLTQSAAAVTHSTLSRPSLNGEEVIEDSVLKLVDALGGEEGGLVLRHVLVGWSAVVRAAHPPRVEVSTHQEDEQPSEVASGRRQQEPMDDKSNTRIYLYWGALKHVLQSPSQSQTTNLHY